MLILQDYILRSTSFTHVCIGLLPEIQQTFVLRFNSITVKIAVYPQILMRTYRHFMKISQQDGVLHSFVLLPFDYILLVR